VETLTCRLLPYACADGPHNMAADEALLQTAAAGTASLRCYGWSEPTVSLGYFQPERVRLEDPNLAALPFVRRPSGGATLVHHHELTYCLALPPGPWQRGEPWLVRMHRIIAAALADLGVRTHLHEGERGTRVPRVHGSFLCFRQFTPGDLLIDSAKVVGSAQRKQRGALLQHGAILLARSLHTPALPGIRELTSVALTASQTMTGVTRLLADFLKVQVIKDFWTAVEHRVISDLVASRYSRDAWNRKR
jgi:lipoate-protein ligase A